MQLPTPTVARPDYEIPDLAELASEPKKRVSYSELAVFRECPLKWLARYVYRLQPPERAVRLDRGSAWHKMLEAHYGAIMVGADRADTRKAAVVALNDYSETIPGGLPNEEFETLTWMYDDYVRIYRNDPDVRVTAIEEEFEFPFPVEGAPELVIVGRIDLETETIDTGARAVWDHKSASQRDVSKDAFLNEMLLEDQFLLYAWAKRQSGIMVKWVVYSAARTDRLKRAMLDTERFARVKIPYSDAALDVVHDDHHAAATALVQMWNDPERIYSAPDPRRCGWKCEFMRPHIEARNSGRDIIRVALDYGFTFKPRSDQPVELEAASDNDELSGW